MHNKWTEKEIQILQECYPIGGRNYTYKVLQASGYHRTPVAISAFAKKHKIKSGYDGRYNKGHTPINKGQIMTQDLREKVKQTWFKKGQLPHNTKHDGAISIRKRYYWIRTSLKKWKQLHRYLWEEANGPIPKGMIITFKDGNSLNCTLENLEMISRQENLRRRQQQSGGHCATHLGAGYVRGVLIRSGIRPEIITPDMIEAKRLQLILKREIQENERS